MESRNQALKKEIKEIKESQHMVEMPLLVSVMLLNDREMAHWTKKWIYSYLQTEQMIGNLEHQI